MPADTPPGRAGLKLRFVLPDGTWLGPGKADLLQGIAETGSISAAGRRLAMSYKRAWGLTEALNAMFAAPLVIANRGGAGHGGAELTPAGHEVLQLYRSMQASAAAATADQAAALLALYDISGRK